MEEYVEAEIIEMKEKKDEQNKYKGGILAWQEELYEKLAKIMKSQVYHYNNYISLGFSISDGCYEMGRNRISDSDLLSIMGRDEVTVLKTYINSHKRFLNAPYAYVEMYLFNNDGTPNKAYDPENLVEDCQKVKHNVDLRSGRVTIYRPYPKIKEKEGIEIKHLLHIICNYDDEMTLAILRFMSYLVFEHGVGKSGRPSLILYGDRGTGKNFLVEHIINKMIPSMSTPLPSNYRDFNSYVEKKFVYLDENELQDNMDSLSRLAKRLSGGIDETVNKKGQPVYTRKINTHFCVMSNKQPIRIDEQPVSEALNQWIVLKMQRPLLQDSNFIEYLDTKGPDLSKWIDNNIGSFMFDVLLPIYKECKNEFKQHRYGFPIPINEALLELVSLSKFHTHSETLNIVAEMLCNGRSDFEAMFENQPNKRKMMYLVDRFKNDGFMSYPLKDAMCNIRRSRVTHHAMRRSLIGLTVDTEVKCEIYITEKGRSEHVYGVFIDMKKVREFFKLDKFEVDDDDDFGDMEVDYESIK